MQVEVDDRFNAPGPPVNLSTMHPQSDAGTSATVSESFCLVENALEAGPDGLHISRSRYCCCGHLGLLKNEKNIIPRESINSIHKRDGVDCCGLMLGIFFLVTGAVLSTFWGLLSIIGAFVLLPLGLIIVVYSLIRICFRTVDIEIGLRSGYHSYWPYRASFFPSKAEVAFDIAKSALIKSN